MVLNTCSTSRRNIVIFFGVGGATKDFTGGVKKGSIKKSEEKSLKMPPIKESFLGGIKEKKNSIKEEVQGAHQDTKKHRQLAPIDYFYYFNILLTIFIIIKLTILYFYIYILYYFIYYFYYFITIFYFYFTIDYFYY